ncbi:MAG: FKBP-type peptidyl-prolyl cis-trans isomerase [Parafilimonas sp.]|nr:FKBP-type peptidyl-prolyl cis-trans isomerase [Parafilimonas sp.]
MTKKFRLKSPLIFVLMFLCSVQCLNAQTKTQTKTQTHTTNQTHTSPQINAGLLKTKSGLQYKIFPGSGGAKPAAGEFVKFRFSYTIGAKDSLLQSSGRMPSYSPVDTGKNVQYSFMEIVPKLSVGDSAIAVVSVDTLVKRKVLPDYSEVFKKGSRINCHIKLLAVFKSDSAVQTDYEAESDVEKAKEVKDIEAYMAQNNIKGELVGNGVYVMIENAGDTSMKADSGTTASIKYKGYLLNGKVFDTNMDSSKGHTDPIDVAVGKHTVIAGWEEALPYFGKGGKGKILIPAMLGYGSQAMGEDIPEYSNLVFDMEIVDVKSTEVK